MDSQEFKIGQTEALRKVLLQGCFHREDVLGCMNLPACSSKCLLEQGRCISTAFR